jgi:hypothetical protein
MTMRSAVSQKGRLVEYVAAALKPTDVSEGEVASTSPSPCHHITANHPSAELSSGAINAACTSLFHQTSYGFHPSDFSSLVADGKDLKVPAYLAMKRWEVNQLDVIPQSAGGRGFRARDVMSERRRVRELVSFAVT